MGYGIWSMYGIMLAVLAAFVILLVDRMFEWMVGVDAERTYFLLQLHEYGHFGRGWQLHIGRNLGWLIDEHIS
jgi:hypothetical protein